MTRWWAYAWRLRPKCRRCKVYPMHNYIRIHGNVLTTTVLFHVNICMHSATGVLHSGHRVSFCAHVRHVPPCLQGKKIEFDGWLKQMQHFRSSPCFATSTSLRSSTMTCIKASVVSSPTAPPSKRLTISSLRLFIISCCRALCVSCHPNVVIFRIQI